MGNVDNLKAQACVPLPCDTVAPYSALGETRAGDPSPESDGRVAGASRDMTVERESLCNDHAQTHATRDGTRSTT